MKKEAKRPSATLTAVLLGVGLLLCAADSRAAGNRTQVFVVAMSDDLMDLAGQINQILRGVMAEEEGLEILDVNEKLQAQAPEQVGKNRDRARGALVAAKEAIRSLDLEAATKQATVAIAAFEKMGGYLDPYERYLEAMMLKGVALALLGEEDKARATFRDLLTVDPNYSLPKGAYKGSVVTLFDEVKGGMGALPRASVSVKSTPRGASLYLNGKYAGQTPTTLAGLVAGQHMVVLKLPGYENWGKKINLDGGSLLPLEAKLKAGQAGGGFLEMVEKAGRGVSESKQAGEVLKLGGTLGLDWIWLCQLKHGEMDNYLDGFIFEIGHAKVAYRSRLTMEPSGYGIEEQAREYGRKFMREGRRALRILREEGDPLDGHAGTEDWYRDESSKEREHREGRAREEEGKKEEHTGDPLDEIDPTKDW